ncbi:MAG: hypothetical protein J5I62_01665 [Flavobacteriales bacterium]|nr:hypothetical protein [Flavobacteriales bacterium]MEB2342657.1 DUF5683 domain-containing protein [Flavobacteriia bacterium]
MIRSSAFLFCLFGLVAAGHGQGGPSPRDTAQAGATVDWRARHKPGRAALYSAILPGAGQVYNRKYWKAPIVLAGLGTCYWFIQDNNKEFQRYKAAYLDVVKGRPDEFNGLYGADQLRTVADTYQRWRDLSYLAMGLVYVLNIVDATVDGYFVRFDISEDLSLAAAPSLELAARGAAGLSFSLALH